MLTFDIATGMKDFKILLSKENFVCLDEDADLGVDRELKHLDQVKELFDQQLRDISQALSHSHGMPINGMR